MRSTDELRGDEDGAEAALAAFWERYLAPAGRSLRARGVEAFPTAPDPEAATYWRRREDRGDYLHTVEPEETAASLRALWAAHPELLALVDPLLELAASLRRQGSDEPAEVSPYVYAMY